MQYNSDLRAQVAIIGHAVFAGDDIIQHLRPDIIGHAETFADWTSGAAIFTSHTSAGKRRVHAISLYKMAPNSDQETIATLLQADFCTEPTTEALSGIPGITLSTLAFKSHSIPIPLIGRVAENIYAQLYHQYHDSSTS
jgi:hypothetical protein